MQKQKNSSRDKAKKVDRKLTKHPIRPPRILVYIDAVVRHGSIRKAAEALHIASSALNRRILELELELGTDLFERLPRGVRLTAAGELFIGYVRRSLADLDLVGSQIEHLRGLVRGQVRIAAAESMAGFLSQVIADFHANHLRVRLDVRIGTPGDLVTALIKDEVDLILGHELPEHRDVSVLFSVENPLCVVLDQNHPLAMRRQLWLRDCVGYPIALADSTLSGRNLIDRVLAKASFHFEPSLVSNSVELMKNYGRLTQSIFFQFRVGAGHTTVRDGMVAIPLSDAELAHAQLVLAVRRGRVLPIAAATFSEDLRLQLHAL
jgi:DNA-binding transcriptional LysR family regulator